MDEQHEHETHKANMASPRSERSPTAQKPQRHLDRQAQRLEDLMIEALEDPDSLRATLKAAVAQLLDIGLRMGEDVKAGMGRGPSMARSNQDGPAGISTLMLVHRQITRYVQLNQQWSSERTAEQRTSCGLSEEAEEAA